MAKGFIVKTGGAGGVDVTEATAVQADVLSGKTFFAGDKDIKTGTIPSKGAQTFTPGTTNQTIAAGQYLSGTQTISGSGNLIAGNIRSGVNIFGVTGNVVPTPNFVNFIPLNYSAPLPANLGPGPTTLVAGNATAGFFGEVSTSTMGITHNDIMQTLGITQGTTINTDVGWLKFIHNGKIKFIGRLPTRRNISWDHIASRIQNQSGFPSVHVGYSFTSGGITYRIRLIRGWGQVSGNITGITTPNYISGPLFTTNRSYSGPGGHNWPVNNSPWNENSPNEWATLIIPVASATQTRTSGVPNWGSFNVGFFNNFYPTGMGWAQETIDGYSGTRKLLTGSVYSAGLGGYRDITSDTTYSDRFSQFRVVLEVE